MIAHLRVIWKNAWQRCLRSVIEDSLGGTRIAGSKWHGISLAEPQEAVESVSECVEWAHRKVNQFICALANRSDHTTHTRFLVVHVATDDQLVDILANILRMRERIIRDIAGLYVPEYRMVLVSGDAKSIQLREHVVHEFSHAICHSMFGATGCISWASEGLAGFVCDKLLQEHDGYSILARELADFKRLNSRAETMSLRRLVSVDDLVSVQSGAELQAFVTQAFVFFEFLYEAAEVNGNVRSLILAAISETPPSARAILKLLEGTFCAPIEEIEEEFLRFCFSHKIGE